MNHLSCKRFILLFRVRLSNILANGQQLNCLQKYEFIRMCFLLSFLIGCYSRECINFTTIFICNIILMFIKSNFLVDFDSK